MQVRILRSHWTAPNWELSSSIAATANVLLGPIDQSPNFLKMSDFITEEKYVEERKNPIVITQLNELPYYARDPEWVRQYMQNRKF